MGQAQPETTQSKRVRTSPAKTPQSAPIPPPSTSQLTLVPPSSPIPNVGEVLPEERVGVGEVEPPSKGVQARISILVDVPSTEICCERK
ncbi:hypothetical protein L3X38_036764 [Prunus dulcis]|uniref:Uncharacterized protein n=1 Tax=Prunus dulcis TaxID=3755 RepID=A0AAD4V452_PRUDU|nr:hypothetical protein L3X38_036764 [Prunus dulcis]